MARAHFELADTKPGDKTWKEDQIRKGHSFAVRALELDNQNAFAHKWFAIMTSSLGDFLGQKEKIQNAFKIKEHALKANELKPKDATTLHLLGRWCFNVANLTWLERTVTFSFDIIIPLGSFCPVRISSRVII